MLLHLRPERRGTNSVCAGRVGSCQRPFFCIWLCVCLWWWAGCLLQSSLNPPVQLSAPCACDGGAEDALYSSAPHPSAGGPSKHGRSWSRLSVRVYRWLQLPMILFFLDARIMLIVSCILKNRCQLFMICCKQNEQCFSCMFKSSDPVLTHKTLECPSDSRLFYSIFSEYESNI